VSVSAAAAEVSITLPPPVPTATVEEGEATTRVFASREALVTTTEAGPSDENVVVVLSEDSAASPPSEKRDAMTPPTSEPAQAGATVSLLPAVEVPVPSPAVEVPGPSPTTEVAETSSARVALTAEEVMELVTCRYIDFPSVGVIDLEEPQLSEKVYEVASERMFNKPMIMETIVSVSKALQEYERAGGFAPAVAVDATETALAPPEAHVEPTTDGPTPPPVNEGQKRRLPTWWKLLKLQPTSQRLTRQKPLSERRDHHYLVRMLLTPRVPKLTCLVGRPRSCKSQPLPRR
jgi:hypothetical protein